MHEYTTTHGLVAPKVYQGNYNAISRTAEDSLFPVLHKYNMAFYAYSPLAGGFLCKSVAQLEEVVSGRWSTANPPDQLYLDFYRQKDYLHVLSIWNSIAEETGIPKSHLACRWLRWHSPLDATRGDAFILGASRLEQVRDIMESTTAGPLDVKTVQQIDSLWGLVSDCAPPAEFIRY